MVTPLDSFWRIMQDIPRCLVNSSMIDMKYSIECFLAVITHYRLVYRLHSSSLGRRSVDSNIQPRRLKHAVGPMTQGTTYLPPWGVRFSPFTRSPLGPGVLSCSFSRFHTALSLYSKGPLPVRSLYGGRIHRRTGFSRLLQANMSEAWCEQGRTLAPLFFIVSPEGLACDMYGI